MQAAVPTAAAAVATAAAAPTCCCAGVFEYFFNISSSERDERLSSSSQIDSRFGILVRVVHVRYTRRTPGAAMYWYEYYTTSTRTSHISTGLLKFTAGSYRSTAVNSEYRYFETKQLLYTRCMYSDGDVVVADRWGHSSAWYPNAHGRHPTHSLARNSLLVPLQQ